MRTARRGHIAATLLSALWLTAATAAAQDEEAATEGDAAGGEAGAEASADASLGLGGGIDAETGLGGEGFGGDDAGEEPIGDAGPGPVLDGALRLGLDLVIFDLSTLSRENDSAGERASTDINFGIRNSQLGAIVGYGLSDALQVGLRLNVALLSGSDENTPPGAMASSVEIDRSGLSLGLMPFVEYIFDMPSSDTRLFALGTLGLRSQSQTNKIAGMESTISGTIFLLGVGGGLHMFLTDSLSFDPALELSYGFGTQTEEMTGAADFEWDLSGLTVALRAGLSGWLEL